MPTAICSMSGWGSNKISNHNVGSPVWQGMTACAQCHAESADWLKAQVFAIQDRTTSLLNRAGYATAVATKLFEAANQAKTEGKNIDQKLYDQAKDLYLEAFYRINYIGAENSVGFHNPTEAERICGDTVAFAGEMLRLAAPDSGCGGGGRTRRYQPGVGQVPPKSRRQKAEF